MGKRRDERRRAAKKARVRGESLAAEREVDALPQVDALADIPRFGDLRVDEVQCTAFEDVRAEASSEDPEMAKELFLGVVVRLDRGFPLVSTRDFTLRCEHAVDFAKTRSDGERMLPAVGDAVAVRVADGHEMGIIERVLPRRTAFVRWRGGARGERQVLAANVDVILIVQALGAARDGGSVLCDRIARSLVLANDCGARPVVVLTKADRCDADGLEQVSGLVRRLVGPEVSVILTSSAEGWGLDEVRACVPSGTCAMILGESGAGKSTLLNALLGHEALATGGVREKDDAGRHTTVARVMVSLGEGCGVITDAPGLRSLPLVGHERGLARTFPEVVEAAQGCRFRDCTHTHEPGCAVRAAVEEGSVDEVRLEACLSLAAEMRVSAASLDPDVSL